LVALDGSDGFEPTADALSTVVDGCVDGLRQWRRVAPDSRLTFRSSGR